MNYYGTCPSTNDIKVDTKQHQPLDTIQSIYWDRNINNQLFIAGGWDGYLSLYGIERNPQKLMRKLSIFLQQPIISCTMDKNYNAFTGHANGIINYISLLQNQTHFLGKHEAAIRGVFWIDQISCLLSFGFDNKLNFWSLQSNQNPVLSYDLPKKTSVVDVDYPYVILGNSEDRFMVFKINNPQNIEFPQYIDSHLGLHSKFNAININADTKRYISGSIDGQFGLGKFHDTSSKLYFDQKILSSYILKTEQYNRSNRLYQVNSVGINPHKPNVSFIAGGYAACSNLIFFSSQQKCKIKQYKFKSPITEAKFSPNGLYLAYSLGCDWTRGLQDLNRYQPKIFCHVIKQTDLTK